VLKSQLIPSDAANGSAVSVKSKGKKYVGKLICTGEKDVVEAKRKVMEKSLEIADEAANENCEELETETEDVSTTQNSKIAKQGVNSQDLRNWGISSQQKIAEEKEKIAALKASAAIDACNTVDIAKQIEDLKTCIEENHFDVMAEQKSIMEEIKRNNELITSMVEQNRKTVTAPNRSFSYSLDECSSPKLNELKRPVSVLDAADTDEPSVKKQECMLPGPADQIMYAGIDLLSEITAPKGDPTRYATRLMDALFTLEEMAKRTVAPSKNGKEELDAAKIDTIKRCISVKYGQKMIEKYWIKIRASMLQKCIDSKRKLNASTPNE